VSIFFRKEFIPNRIVELNDSIEVLKLEQAKLEQNVFASQAKQKDLKSKSELVKTQYLEKLPESERVYFEETMAKNISDQNTAMAVLKTRNLCALVGQAQMALDVAVYADFMSDQGKSPRRVSLLAAKNLLEYKYQFLPKPSDAEYQQELDALLKSVHGVYQAKAIDTAKNAIDGQIAVFVYDQSVSTGKEVSVVLKDILKPGPQFLVMPMVPSQQDSPGGHLLPDSPGMLNNFNGAVNAEGHLNPQALATFLGVDWLTAGQRDMTKNPAPGFLLAYRHSKAATKPLNQRLTAELPIPQQVPLSKTQLALPPTAPSNLRKQQMTTSAPKGMPPVVPPEKNQNLAANDAKIMNEKLDQGKEATKNFLDETCGKFDNNQE
jgi:hypothetical protein